MHSIWNDKPLLTSSDPGKRGTPVGDSDELLMVRSFPTKLRKTHGDFGENSKKPDSALRELYDYEILKQHIIDDNHLVSICDLA